MYLNTIYVYPASMKWNGICIVFSTLLTGPMKIFSSSKISICSTIVILYFQMYIDPKNPRHAREEAETLVALSDTDHDGKLNLSEVLSKMDLFLGSKMIDTARSFHDEFWVFYMLII